MNQYRSIQPDKVSSLGNDVQSEVIHRDSDCQYYSWVNVVAQMKLSMCTNKLENSPTYTKSDVSRI